MCETYRPRLDRYYWPLGAFLILVLLGLGTMWMAVLADMGTSVLVTLNGMRLLNKKPESS